MAGKYLSREDYIQTAESAAKFYCERDLANGVFTAGPEEILQAPDSESSFNFLDALVTLWEVTGNSIWLGAAEKMAKQCATWVVAYDYAFPENSTFANMGMKTTGTVYANAQNRHSAPGICTGSGIALLKLFRATGNRSYLELLEEIARAIPQYLSREDRPIPVLPKLNPDKSCLKPGWMNERVNMADWEESFHNEQGGWCVPRGEIFAGSCWCEVALLLTTVELPGIYIQKDTGVCAVFDNIDCRIVKQDGDSVELEINNPTKFDAEVAIMSELSSESEELLQAAPSGAYKKVIVAAQSAVTITVQ